SIEELPVDDPTAPRTDADRAWSEYNHHINGLFVLLMGVLAVLHATGRAGWARHWPLVFLGMAAFMLVRNDPGAWPIGPQGFWASALGVFGVLVRLYGESGALEAAHEVDEAAPAPGGAGAVGRPRPDESARRDLRVHGPPVLAARDPDLLPGAAGDDLRYARLALRVPSRFRPLPHAGVGAVGRRGVQPGDADRRDRCRGGHGRA